MEEKPLIIVDRYPSEPDWTLSEFFINGIKQGVGVEDEFREKKKDGETRIANGIYPIDFTYSPTFSKHFFMDERGFLNKYQDKRFNTPHLVLLVKNVPDFDGIRWHWGNTDLDSRGCYIVGSYFAPFKDKKGVVRQGVAASIPKYTVIYPIIYQAFLKNKELGKETFVEYRDKLAA